MPCELLKNAESHPLLRLLNLSLQVKKTPKTLGTIKTKKLGSGRVAQSIMPIHQGYGFDLWSGHRQESENECIYE